MSQVEAWECNGIIMVREGNPLAVLAEGQKITEGWRQLAVIEPTLVEREAVELEWPEVVAYRRYEAQDNESADWELHLREVEDGDPLMTVAQHERIVAAMRAEAESLRMQLAACGVVALANTPESAAEARKMHPDYMSASCQDVMRAVDREMELRAQLAAQPAAVPVAWFTDDHMTDKSATTWDREVAERWREKGWPVSPLYSAPAVNQTVEPFPQHERQSLPCGECRLPASETCDVCGAATPPQRRSRAR